MAEAKSRSRLRRAALGTLIVLAAVQLVRPGRSNPPVDPARGVARLGPAPPEVMAILDRACVDCHTNRTRWPWYSNVSPVSWFLANHVEHAREHLNFDEWARFEISERVFLAEAVCRETRAGEMPLASYRPLHPDARLSAQDVETLCAWADRLRSGPASPEG